jgi:GAF domain-containing protein
MVKQTWKVENDLEGNIDVLVDQNYSKTVIYDEILSYIKEVIDFNSASLMVIGKNRKKLRTVAQYGDGCNFINTMHFKMGSGLSAWLAQRKRTICLSDIHRGARHGHNPIRSFVAIPIIFQDNVIGIINLAHILPNAYGPEEVDRLNEITLSIAPKLNNFLNSD